MLSLISRKGLSTLLSLFIFLFCFSTAVKASDSIDAGDGRDSSITISVNTVDSPIDSSASGPAGSFILTATNTSFAIGQKILIHQTQGTGAGNWEINEIADYVAGSITLVNPLTHTYSGKAQVLVLKQYTDVNVNSGVTWFAKSWDGTVGGILGFLANGTITVTGTINAGGTNGGTTRDRTDTANGGGFRGGGAYWANDIGGNTAHSGEGTVGATAIQNSANGNGGGGGTGPLAAAVTGGGGGHATVGGDGNISRYGGTGGAGGAIAGADDLATMVFGGGGGGGLVLNGDTDRGSGSGGNGGGIIFISGTTAIISGAITANGGTGGPGWYWDGGGGGAGGSILIKAQTAALGTSLITANGAIGGLGGVDGGIGGYGGLGRIRVEYCDSLSGTTNPSASTQQLNCNQPPTVDAGGPYQVNEGGSVDVVASGNDPENGGLAYAWDLDNNGSFETPGQSVAFSALVLDGPSNKTIAVQVTDNGSLTATDATTVVVNNLAPVVGTITAPMIPVQVNTAVNASASFTDAGVLDTHTAVWDWQDGTSAGAVTESNGSGSVTGSHTYTTAGVYTVSLTVSDDDLAPGTGQFMYVVVYNPAGGFVTGSGRYNAPAGSIPAAPTESGMTSFGTNAKYVNNVLTGATRLNFRNGQYVFDFDSTSYDWLVITNGNQAQLHGSGTVNGLGSYTFQLTALDGSPDTLRVQIWDATNTIVYDNNTSSLTNGNINIHN